MYLRYLLLLAITPLVFNGCGKTVYITPKQPKLQTWCVEAPQNVKYEVYYDKDDKNETK